MTGLAFNTTCIPRLSLRDWLMEPMDSESLTQLPGDVPGILAPPSGHGLFEVRDYQTEFLMPTVNATFDDVKWMLRSRFFAVGVTEDLDLSRGCRSCRSCRRSVGACRRSVGGSVGGQLSESVGAFVGLCRGCRSI